MAGSLPSLMGVIMPTALFVTADANSTSCRVIGRVLESVRPSVYFVQIYPLYALIKSWGFRKQMRFNASPEPTVSD